jgi:hypothetical protein
MRAVSFSATDSAPQHFRFRFFFLFVFSFFSQEAGLQAVRQNRYVILNKDFEKAYKNNCKRSDQEFEFYN